MNETGGKPAHPETGFGGAAEVGKPLPLQLELPAPATEPSDRVGEFRPERPRRQVPWAKVVAIALAMLAALATAAAALAVWLLPGYVRRQCIDLAAENEVDLAIDDAKIDWAGVHLLGVRATTAQVPGARAQALVMDVQTTALRPHTMTIHGAELILNGPFRKILTDIAAWRAQSSGAQSEPRQGARWVLEGAHVVWRAPIGEGVRVDARSVSAELQAQTLLARSDDVTVSVPQGTLGPWRIDVERRHETQRVRLALDPGVPEACTMLVVGDNERTTSVDVVVPQSPLAHLGVPAQLLGFDLAGVADVQVRANVHYAALGPARADADASGGLYGVEFPTLGHSIDVAWEAAVSGDPSTGIDVKKARLAVGPLVGPLTGTLKRFDDGFRIDLAWAAGPVPCEAFTAPLGFGQPFDIGFALRQIAETSRARRSGLSDGTGRNGNVSATLMVSFDSRDLSQTRIDFAPEIGCAR